MILFSYVLVSTLLFFVGFISNFLSLRYDDVPKDRETIIACVVQAVMTVVGTYVLFQIP